MKLFVSNSYIRMDNCYLMSNFAHRKRKISDTSIKYII